MGRGNSHLFTIIVNGPVNVNDVIDLSPQSFASKRKLHSTQYTYRKRIPFLINGALSRCGLRWSTQAEYGTIYCSEPLPRRPGVLRRRRWRGNTR
jgi:hypothetical protein